MAKTEHASTRCKVEPMVLAACDLRTHLPFRYSDLDSTGVLLGTLAPDFNDFPDFHHQQLLLLHTSPICQMIRCTAKNEDSPFIKEPPTCKEARARF